MSSLIAEYKAAERPDYIDWGRGMGDGDVDLREKESAMHGLDSSAVSMHM